MDRTRIEALRGVEAPTLLAEPEPLEPPASIGLVPGSFDPLTVAHAALAEAASALTDLVLLLYSVRTLPKEGAGSEPPLLSEPERIAVVERYCRERDRLRLGLCSHGLLAEQVAAARRRFPDAQVTLVVGSDKLLQLFDPKWYADREAVLDRLLERATVRYAVREGDEEPVRALLGRSDLARWTRRLVRLDVPPPVAAVSASQVRALARRGGDVGGLVPPESAAAVAGALRAERPG